MGTRVVFPADFLEMAEKLFPRDASLLKALSKGNWLFADTFLKGEASGFVCINVRWYVERGNGSLYGAAQLLHEFVKKADHAISCMEFYQEFLRIVQEQVPAEEVG